MSKERRKQMNARIYEAPEVIPVISYEDLDIIGKSEFIVNEAEWRYLKGYNDAALGLAAQGLMRAASIADAEKFIELNRLNPQGQWAVENGETPPAKKPVNWGDV